MSDLLRGSQLFKYKSHGLEKTVPEKGGDKDYMPDGSWLQNKCIEKYNQERERALSEPRIQKRRDYVQGQWNPDDRLVELAKEMRNFWEVMGFSDNKRKWLFHEEALFLVETNVLQVWYQGLPMSVQEAYSWFLGNEVTLEYYQVYAHLRRIGYVVIRHQGRLEFTKYERQIGLDRYASKKKRKLKHNESEKTDTITDTTKSVATEIFPDESVMKEAEVNKQEMDTAPVSTNSCGIQEMNATSMSPNPCEASDNKQHMGVQNTTTTGMNVDSMESIENVVMVMDDTPCLSVKNTVIGSVSSEANGENNGLHGIHSGNALKDSAKAVEDSTEAVSVHEAMDVLDTDCEKTECSNEDETFEHDNVNNSTAGKENFCVSKGFMQTKIARSDDSENVFAFSKWTFDDIILPNFGCNSDTVTIRRPNCSSLVPGDFEIASDEYTFNKSQYINTKRQKRKDKEYDARLKFSNPEVMTRSFHAVKSCNSWTEYKELVRKQIARKERKKDFPHLFTPELQPLVDPAQATTTYALLTQQQIIEEFHVEGDKRTVKPEILPQFDVYAPGSKFRKSNPGLPDFRILICKSTDDVPDLKIFSDISSHLGDNVTLRAALVDSGEVAFFATSDLTLPLDISLG